MFIALLRFGENKARAGEFMAAHKDWIKQGMDQGIIMLVGNLQPEQGGAVILHGLDRPQAEAHLLQDPFVREEIVEVELLEITPNQTDSRLDFLKD